MAALTDIWIIRKHFDLETIIYCTIFVKRIGDRAGQRQRWQV